MSRSGDALKYFLLHERETESRVRSGIEKNRKGNATVKFKSSSDLPSEITVELRQVSHEFSFGANLFMLDEFETPEKNTEFRKRFPELFNLATLPFYWKDQEPLRGELRLAENSSKIYRRPAADLCIEYCKEKGIEPKAHCLNYDYFRPKWLRDPTVDEHKRELERRFLELAERYADIIPSWEVTNETFNDTFSKEFLDRSGYSRFYRQRDFNKWSFLTADKYFPNNKLIINDHLDFGCMRSLHGEFFGERSPYYAEIDRICREGVHHLDSIGFQYHCFFSPEKEAELAITRYNPEHIFDVLDTYARLGKKLQITEMTVSAFSENEEDEAVQAELLRRLYEIFFSHPAMEAIIYWNVFDGYASGGVPGDMKLGENKYYGGLCRFDLSEKPAYKELDRLINREWRTNITEKAKDGCLRFRGFFGDYDLKIYAGDKVINKKITLSDSKNNIFEIEI